MRLAGASILAGFLAAMLSANVQAGGWEYRPVKDELTGQAKGHGFTLHSTNSVTFKFPYGGPHTADLHIVLKGGDEPTVMISIKGQILHEEGARIVTDKDAGTDGSLPASLAKSTDGDPSVAFITPYMGLFKARAYLDYLAKAKLIKIELTFFQNGKRVFTFNPGTPLAEHPVYAKEMQAAK